MPAPSEIPIQKITISIYKRQVKEIDHAIGQGFTTDRSSFIREAIDAFITDKSNEVDETGENENAEVSDATGTAK